METWVELCEQVARDLSPEDRKTAAREIERNLARRRRKEIRRLWKRVHPHEPFESFACCESGCTSDCPDVHRRRNNWRRVLRRHGFNFPADAHAAREER